MQPKDPIEPVDDQEDMMDHVAMEAMDAIQSGDKAAFRDAFHVMISDIINKMSREMGEK